MKEKSDMVVAFAFGAFLAKDIFRSTNYWIARKAGGLAKKYDIPLITQGDIAIFFEEDKTLKIFNAQENPKKYISTIQIALAAKRLAIQLIAPLFYSTTFGYRIAKLANHSIKSFLNCFSLVSNSSKNNFLLITKGKFSFPIISK